MLLDSHISDRQGYYCEDLPKTDGDVSGIHTITCIMFLNLVKMLQVDILDVARTDDGHDRENLPILELLVWHSAHPGGYLQVHGVNPDAGYRHQSL